MGVDVIPEISQTSQIMIHGNGETCELSLMVLHDERGDDSGGNAEFVISGDLTQAVVLDDPPSDHPDDYVFDPVSATTTASWSWQGCCTDGLAHILSPNFGFGDCITITPTLNGFRNIDRWVFVSGPITDRVTEDNNRELSMTETLEICRVANGCSESAVYNVTVLGTDAISLAGRTDVVIPPASQPWSGPGTLLLRHGGPTPEEALETFPSFLDIQGGDILRIIDPAVGGVNFLNGFGPPFFGPSGDGVDGSAMDALDGISGYQGPRGPLVGVFLNDDIPSSGPAPTTIDFGPSGIGVDFVSLSPELGQIFYIGNGVTSSNRLQQYVAPLGATRVFFGIPDGFGFGGPPGAYDDNDGSYVVTVGINKAP